MRVLHLALFMALLAFPVSAQTLAIRSGEHENFSRLVLSLPADVEWVLTQQGRKAVLILDLPQVRFGVADVFKRIPRTRLAGLSQTGFGAPLEMILACDCDVKGFILSDRRLVIDIMDAKAPSVRSADIEEPLVEPTFRFPATAAGERAIGKTPFMLDSRYRHIIPRPKISRPDSGSQSGGNGDKPPLSRNIDKHRVASRRSERRLLDQIDRAVDQGLLDLAGPSTDKRNTEGLKRDPKSHREILSRPGLSAQTAIDRDMADLQNAVEISGYGRNCYPAEKLKLSEWGNDKPFSDQIGAWRSELFQEFDILNRDAQIALARNYLYFGFGTEAAQILDLSKYDQEDTDVLREMSRILDDLDMVSTDSFLFQHGCGGASALWAVLAAPGLPPETNSDAVLQTLAELPAHLRRQIGLRISRIYMNTGHVEIANTALRIAERASASHDPAVGLAAAEINAMKGNRKAASQQAAEVVASGTEDAADALVKLVRMTWETGGELPPETAELAEAYAMEYRGSTLGDRLQESHILALAMQNQFRTAFETLATYEHRAAQPASADIRHALFTATTEWADDVVFLELVLENTPLPAEAQFDHVTEKMARRLMNLGFFDEAGKLLGDEYGDIIHDDGRMIRAETALAADLPHRAMAVLGESVGPEADRLRAEALSKNKDHAKAATLFMQADEAASAARSFWLAGELDNIPVETPVYGETAQIIRALDAAHNVELPPTPLAQARALLEASELAREDIFNLLDAMRVERDFDDDDAS